MLHITDVAEYIFPPRGIFTCRTGLKTHACAAIALVCRNEDFLTQTSQERTLAVYTELPCANLLTDGPLPLCPTKLKTLGSTMRVIHWHLDKMEQV